jgi:hypothetical protein
VYPNEGKVFHVAEGICASSYLTLTDDCLSHQFYDYNMDLLLDPQYACMIADGSNTIHTEREAPTLPQWAWPSAGSPSNPNDGDRVWMAGEFVYDCGHCAGGSDLTGCYTEIHPIIAMATIRNRPDTLAASGQSGYVPATRADVWIYGDAGCANAIQCEDDNANCPPPWPTLALCSVPNVQPYSIAYNWTFAFALPPRPTPDASPAWRFEARPGDRFPTLTPAVTFVPAANGSARDSLRVSIDLRGATNPGPFARSLVAGWAPGWSGIPIHHFQVVVDTMQIYDDLDGFPTGEGEWYFSIDVNGVWQQALGNIRNHSWTSVDGGQLVPIGLTFDVAVADTGAIVLNSTGFDDDSVLGCTILNGDPGVLVDRWTRAENFGAGRHNTRTAGGDNPNGAAGVRYHITEVGQPTGVPLVAAGARTFALSADRTLLGAGGVSLRASGPEQTSVALRIFSATGALVRTLAASTPLGPTGQSESTWDGRDDRGRSVASGLYMAVLQSGGKERATARVVVVR